MHVTPHSQDGTHRLDQTYPNTCSFFYTSSQLPTAVCIRASPGFNPPRAFRHYSLVTLPGRPYKLSPSLLPRGCRPARPHTLPWSTNTAPDKHSRCWSHLTSFTGIAFSGLLLPSRGFLSVTEQTSTAPAPQSSGAAQGSEHGPGGLTWSGPCPDPCSLPPPSPGSSAAQVQPQLGTWSSWISFSWRILLIFESNH